MKTLKFLPLAVALLSINTSYADADSTSFMSTRDILHNLSSANIFLQNNRNTNLTVYGLYVSQYAYVSPGQSCDSATIIFTGNTTAGSVATPVQINAGKSVPVGSNYLYNMILSAIYYENIIIPSAPPGCALPGCTWGSDTLKYNWCIYLGALAPVANSASYTSNISPAAEPASGGGYNYDLISSYVYLGPISCNDQTLTCTVASSQTQTIS